MSILVIKALADLRLRPGRSFLMGLAVLLGAASMTGGMLSEHVLTRSIAKSYAESLPPNAVLVTGAATDAALSVVQQNTTVAAAEPRRILRGRIKTREGHNAALRITVVPALTSQAVSRVDTIDGETWRQKGLFIERSSLPIWGRAIGTEADIRLPGGVEFRVVTAGVAADGAVAPGIQDRIVYAYVDPHGIQHPELPRGFSEIHVRLKDDVVNPENAIDSILRDLHSAGIEPTRVERSLQRHPHADQMQAVLNLLAVFAAAAILVAATLTANIVAAGLRAEQKLIGVSKALGASQARIIVSTQLAVSLVALPAVVVGTMFGVVASNAFVAFASAELNLVAAKSGLSAWIIAASMAISLAIPSMATVFVAWRAASIEPIHAIQPERRKVGGSGRWRPARSAAPSIARAYAFRNLGTKPTRLVLMLGALSLGGTALLCAANVHRSLNAAVDRVFDARLDDVDIRLLRPVPIDELKEATRNVRGVETIEYWGGLLVALGHRTASQSSSRFGLLAPPVDTSLLQMPVAEGRWIVEAGAVEFVASRNLVAKYPELQLGEPSVIAYEGRRVPAVLVGIIEEATEPGIYASPALYEQLVGASDTAGALRIVSRSDSQQVARRLEGRLFDIGVVPALVFERQELKAATKSHFVILLILLGIVAVTALIVGGLGLGASVAISIVERAREIGIIRAVGSSDPLVRRLFLRESLVLCGVAFGLALVLAFPASAALAGMLGEHALHISIPLQVSLTGTAVWAAAVFSLGIVFTYVPVNKRLREPPAVSLVYY